MNEFNSKDLKKIFVPRRNSHKGENGKLMIIAGSILFHAAALWPLEVASRIVDMVFFSSVPMNNEIVQKDKNSFRNGIIVPRNKIENYIDEADAVLIGPGLPRVLGEERKDDNTKRLTEKLLVKYPLKKWVIDGGSLQTIDPKYLPKDSILTPHPKEFETLFNIKPTNENAINMAKKYKVTIILKGPTDIVTNGGKTVLIKGGNQGMTKGGTGDVLSGLVASFYTKNEPFLSAATGSYINKKAGESLYKRMGLYFNASDLAMEIPIVMKKLL
jgi:NAD(P)H-hydrate epimerase